jgi:outer membrane protein assembly factor BamB
MVGARRRVGKKSADRSGRPRVQPTGEGTDGGIEMRRTSLLTAMVLVACSGSKGGKITGSVPDQLAGGKAPQAAGGAVATDDGPPAGEDVSAAVAEMNSEKYGRPPTKFRKGHVRTIKAPPVKKTSRGYQVQFASHAPITTPAVYQGTVFVSGGFRSKEFHAFDADTGKPTWSVALDDDGPSTPACAEGVCVFNTESCTVFAVASETGKMLWSWWLGDPLTSSPTIANGLVFTSYPASGTAGGKARPPGATHALAAFDLKTGEIAWQKWLDSDVMSAPVATEGFVYISTFGGTLMKLEQKTGKVRYAVRARATSAPVVNFAAGVESMYFTGRPAAQAEKDGAEEMIIRTDHNHPKTKYRAAKKKADYLDDKVQAETDYADEAQSNDAANGFSGGAPAAANPSAAKGNIGQSNVHSMQAFQGSRILHLGDRNINTMGDEVIATSAETGDKLWTYKLPGNLAKAGGFLGSAPLAAGSSVLFATLDGKVIRVDPATGKRVASYDVGARVRSQPVAEGGWIFVGTEDGRLVAIDTRDASLTGWPMWGGNAARTGIKLARQ